MALMAGCRKGEKREEGERGEKERGERELDEPWRRELEDDFERGRRISGSRVGVGEDIRAHQSWGRRPDEIEREERDASMSARLVSTFSLAHCELARVSMKEEGSSPRSQRTPSSR